MKRGKKYIRGRVDEKVFEEFILNAFNQCGPKHGYMGCALESALKLYNYLYKEKEDTCLPEIADELNIGIEELYKLIIETYIEDYLTETIKHNHLTRKKLCKV